LPVYHAPTGFTITLANEPSGPRVLAVVLIAPHLVVLDWDDDVQPVGFLAVDVLNLQWADEIIGCFRVRDDFPTGITYGLFGPGVNLLDFYPKMKFS